MEKYEENMKKYEGITLPISGPWDLEKFRARLAKYELGGRVGERKDMEHVKSLFGYLIDFNLYSIIGQH